MGVSMRYHKQKDDAAAMVNQGFLKIVNNLEKYDSEIPFEYWIKRIMINTLIDDFRKNKKFKELIEHHDFTDRNAFQDLVNYNEADEQFEAEELRQMIQLLPNVSQKVFNLFAIDGYSHREIAERMGISEGTSKWHVSFARKKLQEMILNSRGKNLIIQERKL